MINEIGKSNTHLKMTIRLIDSIGVPVEIPQDTIRHMKIFDMIDMYEDCDETQERVYPISVCSSYHLKDVFSLLQTVEEDDKKLRLQSMLKEQGFEYFGSCLSAAEYLQCDGLIVLFKKVLSERINSICNYQDDVLDTSTFSDRVFLIKQFLGESNREMDEDSDMYEKPIREIIIESRHLYGHKYPHKYIYEDFYNYQEVKPYLVLRIPRKDDQDDDEA